MKSITLTMVRDDWQACYPHRHLARLFPRPRTPLQVLTLRAGPWRSVPAAHRLWCVLHDGVLSDRVLRLFACDCARRALLRDRAAGREPHRASWRAIEVAERFALGKATPAELSLAHTASAPASRLGAAAYSAAAAAYSAAAYAAACSASAASASAAAYSAAHAAAYASASAEAAEAAERREQVQRLLAIMLANATKATRERSRAEHTALKETP